MVGHIAQTGQIVAVDFREGNVSPAKQNLEFIQQCQAALPNACYVKFLRIDAAGYQQSIIEHCEENNIRYAIRAVKSKAVKAVIEDLKESDWQSFVDRAGNGL